ncbi:MAG: hypothetical protein U9P14_08775 [Gemmatimonadota bacterium]|nr:hypothetical protein [Gemmatimonadota bacterium]
MKRNSITLVLIGNSREPLTMEISVKEAILIVTLLLALIGTSIYSLANLKELKAGQNQLSFANQELKAELAVREKRIIELGDNLQKQKDMVLMVEGQDTTEVSFSTPGRDIKIADLEISPLDRGIQLEFRMVNNRSTGGLLSGYLMVIVEHNSGDYNKSGTFPEFEHTSGLPIDFREGDTYAIRKFKTLSEKIALKDTPDMYNCLKFLVFSEKGEIILYDQRVIEW